eukprot:g41398.t1
MVDPTGLAAIARELSLRNPHHHDRRFKWLAEGRAVAASVGDVRGGGGLGWMLPQELAHRAAVNVQLVATAFQCLKTALLGPNMVHQLEDAQVRFETPSAHTPAWAEFHICPRILRTLPIFGHPVWRGAGRSEDLLVALLLGLAQLVMNRSRQRAMEGVIMVNYLPLFCGYVRARVSLEKEHA